MIDEIMKGQFGCGDDCGRPRSYRPSNCMMKRSATWTAVDSIDGYLWIVDAMLVENESFERGNSGNPLSIADGTNSGIVNVAVVRRDARYQTFNA